MHGAHAKQAHLQLLGSGHHCYCCTASHNNVLLQCTQPGRTCPVFIQPHTYQECPAPLVAPAATAAAESAEISVMWHSTAVYAVTAVGRVLLLAEQTPVMGM